MPKTGRPLKHGTPLVGKMARLPQDVWEALEEKARGLGISVNHALLLAARKWVGRRKVRCDAVQFDEDEWFDVARVVNPALTREEFAEMWREFLRVKEERRRKLAVN